MRIVTDTNILVRLIVDSKCETDLQQAQIAAGIIDSSEEVVIPTHVFCEFVWVLSSAYKFNSEQILFAIESILNMQYLNVKEDEVEAGMEMLKNGGDFAGGVNEYVGRSMARGRTVFVSFDKKAVRLLAERGISAMVPSQGTAE